MLAGGKHEEIISEILAGAMHFSTLKAGIEKELEFDAQLSGEPEK